MSANAPVQPGQILAGKYRVERVLGAGGMGVVVAAVHVALHERVALKFLLPEAARNPEIVARFAREARSAVRIKSEHVARVIDVGELQNGAPFMVMEYLHGTDLAQLVSTRGPLPVGEAVDYVLQAADALAEAHALGIVHRDLKPANLFVTRRANGAPLVKVLDFGISKVALTGSSIAGDVALTQASAVMGSPLYMSPEQMRSAHDVDQRTDIWSLGIVLYELLTGHAAFRGTSITELCASVLQAPAPPLRAARSDAPDEIGAVVARCLEKQPERRFQNVAELALALAPFASAEGRLLAERTASTIRAAGQAVSVPALPVATAPHGATTTSWADEASRSRAAAPAPKRLWPLAIVGGVLAVAAGAATAILATRPSAPETAPSAASAPSAARAIETAAPAGGSASGAAGAPTPVVAPVVAPADPAPSASAPPHTKPEGKRTRPDAPRVDATPPPPTPPTPPAPAPPRVDPPKPPPPTSKTPDVGF